MLRRRVPDFISAVRLAMAAVAGYWAVYDDSVSALTIVLILGMSRLLDLSDGYVARRLGAPSTSGPVVDMVADLGTHAIVWWVSGLWFAWGLILLEWVAGFGILLVSVRETRSWKGSLTDGAPGWIQFYFSANQRNLLCAYASVCHFLVPAAAITSYTSPLTNTFLVPGLIAYEAATLYLIKASWARVLNERKNDEVS